MLAAVIEFLALRVLAGSLGIVVAWEAWGRWLCVRISTGSLGIVVAWELWDAGFGCVSPPPPQLSYLCVSCCSKHFVP